MLQYTFSGIGQMGGDIMILPRRNTNKNVFAYSSKHPAAIHYLSCSMFRLILDARCRVIDCGVGRNGQYFPKVAQQEDLARGWCACIPT